MQIFAKKFYSFYPETLPVITFSQPASRRSLLSKAKRGDRIIYVAVEGNEADESDRGKILGMCEIGASEINSLDAAFDKTKIPKDHFDLNGDYKWPLGIPMLKAWKFSPSVHRLEIFDRKRIDSQATRAQAILLNDDETQKILNLACIEVELPKTVKMDEIQNRNNILFSDIPKIWRQEANRMANNICNTVKNSNGQVVQRAVKNKNLEMSRSELEVHLLEVLVKEQNYKCAITGRKLDIHSNDKESNWLAPSADRIDSEGHYQKGNIQIVSWAVNRAKSDIAPEELDEFFDALQYCTE